MKRLNGLMPTNEIKMTVQYRNQDGLPVGIDAGEHGWTIRWPGREAPTFQDCDDTVEENFRKALGSALSTGCTLIEEMKTVEDVAERPNMKDCACKY